MFFRTQLTANRNKEWPTQNEQLATHVNKAERWISISYSRHDIGMATKCICFDLRHTVAKKVTWLPGTWKRLKRTLLFTHTGIRTRVITKQQIPCTMAVVNNVQTNRNLLNLYLNLNYIYVSCIFWRDKYDPCMLLCYEGWVTPWKGVQNFWENNRT